MEKAPGQKVSSAGQYELDFDQPADEQKEVVEQKDLNGRTRAQVAKDFRVMNPEKLFFNDEIKQWMMSEKQTVEEWDDENNRLDEPEPDDFVRGRK